MRGQKVCNRKSKQHSSRGADKISTDNEELLKIITPDNDGCVKLPKELDGPDVEPLLNSLTNTVICQVRFHDPSIAYYEQHCSR